MKPDYTNEEFGIQLYCADCLDVLPTLKGKVGAVITDPPYGISYKSGEARGGKWHKVRHEGVAILGDNKPFDPLPFLDLSVPCVFWGANFYSDKLPGSGWLVWDKRRGIEGMEFNRSDSEVAYISNQKTVKTFRHLWHGICRDSEIGKHLHPTQKPVALMVWCFEQLRIDMFTTVLDPFMGSCPTGVACINTDRKFIGIEKDPKYFKICIKRIEKAIEERRELNKKIALLPKRDIRDYFH